MNTEPPSPIRTQKEVGQMLGVTQSRIHQIEKRALLKLRNEITRLASNAGLTPREWLFEETQNPER